MWHCDAPDAMSHPEHGLVFRDKSGWWWLPRDSGLKRGPFPTVQEALAAVEEERSDA